MPLYEYECEQCQQRTEIIQRFDDPPLATCPECGGAVRRLLSAPAVQFKGTGWYVTDYASKKPAASASSGGEGDAKPAAGKAEAAKEKPAAKPAEKK